jgi:hypothetical protein
MKSYMMNDQFFVKDRDVGILAVQAGESRHGSKCNYLGRFVCRKQDGILIE